MVLRTFPAFDNEAFQVDASSPKLTPGDPLINNSNVPKGSIFLFVGGFPTVNVTLDDTGGKKHVFNDDKPGSHTITDGQGLVPNGTHVESESQHLFRALDECGHPVGPVIEVTVFSRDGHFSNIWGAATDTPLVPGTRYLKVGGDNHGDSLYSTFVPCFAGCTRIATPQGIRLVDDLRAGDRVLTRDSGFQEIAWAGRKTLSAEELAREPALRPIRIAAGSLGPGNPTEDLIVSPNHQVLFAGSTIGINFGSPEVLIAAKFLTHRPGVHVITTGDVSYHHVLFEQHEAVLSNGCWSESFLPGPEALQGVGRQQSDEILRIFPELDDAFERAPFKAARQILSKFEAVLAQ